jgi:glycosyltransferase involved in cell wall biosynthesis
MMKSTNVPKVFMMDLWATVPYYTAYLSKALLAEDLNLTVGSISYYLDPSCFSSRGIKVDPGLVDIVGRFAFPRWLRRFLKFGEAMLNMCALSVRFLISPPSVIHVQYLPMLKWKVPLDFWFLKLCRYRGAKVILTVHDLLPHDTADRYKQTFHALYAMVDGLICHSDHVKKRLREEFDVQDERIWVIPHGPFFYDVENLNAHEVQQELGLCQDELLVLWQGIIFPYKGIDLLLNAWRSVEAAVPRATLVIAGTGREEFLNSIREQVSQLDLKRVKTIFRFISTEELVALYRAAEVVVYPYRAITTSGALSTGLAMGKAIVASDLPVFRELLTSGESALLVDPQNAEQLSGALIDLLSRPELRALLASTTAKMNFGDESWIQIARGTIEVYKSLQVE